MRINGRIMKVGSAGIDVQKRMQQYFRTSNRTPALLAKHSGKFSSFGTQL